MACLGLADGWSQPQTPGSEARSSSAAETIEVIQAAPPNWIEPRTWTLPTAKAASGVPAEILLSDRQDLLGDTISAYYYRNVVLLRNAEGVRRCAEWTVEYSPEYESVTWHALRVIRSGEVSNRLEKAKFRKLQREQRLESRIVDGRITIATVLEDIRVGDVLEIEYTLESGNPALRGQLGTRHYLGSSFPIQAQHVVVRAPRERPLKASFFLPDGTLNLPSELYRPAALRLGLETEETADQSVFRWSGLNLPAVPFDDNVAPRASPYYPMLRISSFSSWAEVADWGRGLFSEVGEPPAETLEWIQRCRSEHATQAERLAAAVRWVQRDLRYFAMAMGAQNLRPRKLAEICATRFGDCKDKSALLVAVLRGLGIEAWPVLVNSVLKERIREHGPGPFAFDHAIVAYRLDGSEHWVDPTIEHQGGGPGTWSLPPYRCGLILREKEHSLTDAPANATGNEPDTYTEDTVTVSPSGDATLTTTTQLRGLKADEYRYHLASTGASEISLRWVNFLGRFYRSIEEQKAVEIEDDPVHNLITLKATYTLPQFVGTEGGLSVVTTHAYSIRALLDAPQSRRRRWPYALPGDRVVRHRIVVELPFDLSVEQQPQLVVTDELVYRTEKGLNGRRFTCEHELRLLKEFVAAEDMAVFASSVEDVLQALSTSLRSPVATKDSKTATGGP
ncbi:MAG: DUF3857 domain-containing transglutaminase family protein [Opitutaceae bacterium]